MHEHRHVCPHLRIILRNRLDYKYLSMWWSSNAANMAYTFGNFHRLSADAYKSVYLELFVGAAALMAEYNGVERASHIQDIAGGIVVTAPSSKDFLNPETRPMIEKYLGGKAGVSTEHRLRLIKLIKELTSTYEEVLTLHAEGSLAAQRLSIYALADFERYRAAAKRAARIKDGTEHPLYNQLPDFH